MWSLFGYWLLILLGLLWVKRVTRNRLQCNIFSAAIASAIFLGISLGFTYLIPVIYHQGSDLLKVAYFLFMGIGMIPIVSAMTLLLGKWFIPFFKIEVYDIMSCTAYMTGWVFIALILVSIFKVLGFLLMALLFGGGMPKVITRASNDEYYYY